MASLMDFLGGLNRRKDEQIFTPIQRFGMGLDALVLPESRIGQNIRDQALAQYQENKERNQKNRTAEFLKSQPGGAIYASAIEAGMPLDQVYAAYLATQKGDYVVVGNSLVDRKTGKVIFNDKGGAGAGGFTYRMADGSVVTFGGGGGVPDLNQDKANAALFGGRMQRANERLNAVDLAGTSFFQNALNFIPFGAGRPLQTDEFRSYDDARRDFVNAVLRRESGAAIAESEFESANRQYFPVPGDSDTQIQEKRMRREQAVIMLLASSGAEGMAYATNVNAKLNAIAKELNPKFGTKSYDDEMKQLGNVNYLNPIGGSSSNNTSSSGNTIEP